MEDVTLRIGASDVAASLIIPALLGTFQKDHPTVHLEVNHANSRTIQSQLISEEIELGFIGGSLDDDRIEFEKIGVDTLICVAAADLLAGRKASLSQAELCKVPLIIREDGSGTQKAIDDALAVTWLNKESFTIIARLGSSEAIRNAVQNKAGYAFISDRMIADELATGQLLTVRIPGVHITRTLYAVRRGGRELSPAAAAFLKLVLDQSK
jgi:DNA-binding transcriptional LysR family regulator